MVHETLFSHQLPGQVVQCQTCAHFCIRSLGQTGRCGVRQNQSGRMVVLNYGQLISAAVDPIEKKPLFHFLPGTTTFSIAAAGCNFSCGHCQNWQISQISKITRRHLETMPASDHEATPAEIISAAVQEKCASLSYTYTEPTIFVEFALDVMKAARAARLKNCWVSNGFMSLQTRQAIIPYLDAINIDLKYFTDSHYRQFCGARLTPVLDNIIAIKKAGVWVELTTLIVPGQNDTESELTAMAHFIKQKVGADTPWHLSRFSPEISYRAQNVPTTPLSTIQRALKIGARHGLEYVYSGNVPGDQSENTFCPRCRTLIIARQGYQILCPLDSVNACPHCQKKITLRWD